MMCLLHGLVIGLEQRVFLAGVARSREWSRRVSRFAGAPVSRAAIRHARAAVKAADEFEIIAARRIQEARKRPCTLRPGRLTNPTAAYPLLDNQQERDWRIPSTFIYTTRRKP
jgi:hypothetical protein